MDFKQQLIKKLKKHPDLYNEIRAEVITADNQMKLAAKEQYVKPDDDHLLQEVADQVLITSLIDNLNYYLEYEKEIGESDL